MNQLAEAVNIQEVIPENIEKTLNIAKNDSKQVSPTEYQETIDVTQSRKWQIFYFVWLIKRKHLKSLAFDFKGVQHPCLYKY